MSTSGNRSSVTGGRMTAIQIMTIEMLHFQPIPLRSGSWRAEATNLRYEIYQNPSGYMISCERIASGQSTGHLIRTPRTFFQTFDDAVAVCRAHYRTLA